MALTLYTTPACTQCTMTRRVLDRANITYTTVDLSTDLDAHRFVTRTLGHKTAPVAYAVYPDGHIEHWAGFQPKRLETYAKAFGGAVA